MTERFTIDDWLMYDNGEHINTRQAVKLLNELYDENQRLKLQRSSDDEKYTVEELSEYLLHLIDLGYENHNVKLSVSYDNCDHIQGLKSVWFDKSDDINWVILGG